MTIQDMHNWFNQLQDKYGSPYFSDDMIDLFLNRAQIEYLNTVFPDNEGGVANIEQTQLITENFDTLVYETTSPLYMNASGMVSRATIQTRLNSETGSTEGWRHILNVSADQSGIRLDVKFRRHNDFYRLERNTFKIDDQDKMVYRLESRGLLFTPINVQTKLYFTLMKLPKPVSLSGSISSELPAYTHNEIVAIAVDFAGIASRDEALIQLNQLQ